MVVVICLCRTANCGDDGFALRQSYVFYISGEGQSCNAPIVETRTEREQNFVWSVDRSLCATPLAIRQIRILKREVLKVTVQRRQSMSVFRLRTAAFHRKLPWQKSIRRCDLW